MANNNAINRGTNIFVGSVVSRIFTATDTYTPTSGMLYCEVGLVGGGGSGGAVPSTAAGTAGASGGGGASYCFKRYTAAEIGASASIVIGAGGAAAAAGNNNGNSGGNSSFNPAGTGVLLSAPAGGGGVGMASTTSPSFTPGGLGGAASGGDINIDGANAPNGYTLGPITGIACGGAGGDSQYGRGGPSNQFASSSSSNGGEPTGYGSGSCGSAGINSATPQASHPGRPGICIITEYVAAI